MNTTTQKTPCQILKEQAMDALKTKRDNKDKEKYAAYDSRFNNLKKTFPLLERTGYCTARLCGDDFLINEVGCLGYSFYYSRRINTDMYNHSFYTLAGYGEFLEWKKRRTFFGIRFYRTKPIVD